MHGLRPGFSFFSSGETLVYTIFFGMILAQIVFAVLGIVFAKQFARVTKTPNAILIPIILVMCFAGAYDTRKKFLIHFW